MQHTPNATFESMRRSRLSETATAVQSVQDHTFLTLKSLVNMHGAELSVYSY